jgi:predicted nucleic acid-binding protein
MRVFLDANVIFAASKQDSQVAKLFDLITTRAIPITSDYALEEAARNVTIKRPDWIEGLDAIIPKIEIIGTCRFDLPVDLVEKDVPILCSAIQNKCDYLVTGDKRDFGHLYGRNVKGVTIVDLLMLADILLKS